MTILTPTSSGATISGAEPTSTSSGARDDSVNLHGFLSRTADAEYAFGAHTSYKLSDAFDLTFAGVRRVNDASAGASPPPVNETVYSVGSQGNLASVDYSAIYATYTDGVDTANAVEAHASLPISVATVSVDYGYVDAGYTPAFAKVLDSGKDMEFDGRDWLERHLTPAEDWLEEEESAYTATLSLPIFGINTSASMGRLVANGVERK